jgi:hypothetical protein
LFDNVYKDAHAILAAERADYAAYLDGFDDAGVTVGAGTEESR